MKTHAAVFTYRRPKLLAKLLDQLSAYDITVDVFDDDPETCTHTFLVHGERHHVAEANHGKTRFWQWVTRAFGALRSSDADRFIFLPDDVSLCDDFLERCEERWATLPEKAVSLNLLVDHRAAKANWTGKLPVRYNDLVEETWWTDGCFYADRRFFDALGWSIQPINLQRWRSTYSGIPPGSGVWAQASRRLVAYRLFRSYQSLVYNHGAESLMNPIGRQHYPAATLRWIDA